MTPAGNAGVREKLEAYLSELLDQEKRAIHTPIDAAINAIRSALALPQPPEAFADEIKRADAAPPITNPLVLPAGIKAGDYASPSPIPEAPVRMEAINFFSENVDAWGAAEWFNRLATAIRRHDAAVLANDDAVMEICRNVAASSAMRLVRDYEQQVRSALRALKPQDGGKCEHGIMKVNCGICVPSEVFSGGSGR